MRALGDLTAFVRDEAGPQQPPQPAAFEFAGQEIADFDLEVLIIAEPAEGSRRPVREQPLVDFHLGPAADLVEEVSAALPLVAGMEGQFAIDIDVSRVGAGFLRRSEERRVGKECVSTCRSRWLQYP